MNDDLPLVSVVFVTYERLQTLVPTLESFLANTDYPRDRLELIITDDGSPAPTQDAIRRLGVDRVCVAPKARTGLGANVNRGLAAAAGAYILQMQDDWECVGPPDYLRRVIRLLDRQSDVGMLVLNQHPNKPPILRRAMDGDWTMRVYDNEPERHIGKPGEHAYTDWPQIKRRAFIQSIGPYRENAPMWESELDYSRRVNAQRATFVADVEGLVAFRHIGADLSFNTGTWRTRLDRRISRWRAGRALLHAFRTARSRLPASDRGQTPSSKTRPAPE